MALKIISWFIFVACIVGGIVAFVFRNGAWIVVCLNIAIFNRINYHAVWGENRQKKTGKHK